MQKKSIYTGFILSMMLLTLLPFTAGQELQNTATISGIPDMEEFQPYVSEVFEVPTNECNINWNYISSSNCNPEYVFFSFLLYHQNGQVIKQNFNTANQTQGTIFLNIEEGTYFLKVFTANVDSFTITIDAGPNKIIYSNYNQGPSRFPYIRNLYNNTLTNTCTPTSEPTNIAQSEPNSTNDNLVNDQAVDKFNYIPMIQIIITSIIICVVLIAGALLIRRKAS
jgi:hypothetical protein